MQHWRLSVVPDIRPAHDWTNRRRVVQLSLVFCACAIAYIIYNPGVGEAAITRGSIAQALVGGAIGIIGSYVFGATYDDRTRAQFPVQGNYRSPRDPDGDRPDLPMPAGDLRRGVDR